MARFNPDASVHGQLARLHLKTARWVDRRLPHMRRSYAGAVALSGLEAAVKAATHAEYSGDEKLLMDSVRLARSLQTKALGYMKGSRRAAIQNPLAKEGLDPKDEKAVMAAVEKAKEGDDKAKAALYAAFYPATHRIALKIVKGGRGAATGVDLADADDVAQTTWAAILVGSPATATAKKKEPKILKFEGKSKFLTWLHKVTENEASTLGRASGRFSKGQKKLSRSEREQLKIVEEAGQIQISAGAQAIASAVVAAMRGLPKKDRELLTMADVQGMNLREIGEQTGVSKALAGTELARTRGAFQRLLHKKLAPVDDVKELEKMAPDEQREKFEREKMRLAAMEATLTKLGTPTGNPRRGSQGARRSGSLMRRMMRL